MIDEKTKEPKIDSKTGLPKQTKVPYQIYGEKASTDEPKTWTSFEKALQAYRKSPDRFNGIGYVFSESDPYTGLDLDSDPDKGAFRCKVDGQFTEEAQAIIDTIDSYTEHSPSGNGVHIIVEGSLPGNRNRTGNYEMYDQGRFFTFTGDHLPGTPGTIEERQDELNGLYNMIFAKEAKKIGTGLPEPKSPQMNDEIILSIARSAKNGEKFNALYAGDFSSYDSQSEADQGLCNMLAFYTQYPEQLDRLFRGSGLMREKWNEKHYGDGRTYGQGTISTAICGLTAQYEGKKNNPIAGARADFSIPQDEWEELLELPPKRDAVPSLPEDMVPAPLLPWLKDIMKGACIPLEYVAAPTIVGLSAIIGRKVGIRPEEFSYYTTICNLWGTIVGRPGVMKTYAVSETLKPIDRLEQRAREKFKEEKAMFEADEESQKIEIDVIKKKMAATFKPKKGETPVDDLETLKEELAGKLKESEEQLTQKRYMVQDTTIEKVGELLNENTNGLLLKRDELSGWLLGLEKTGKEGDKEFYLESWNGSGNYMVDRIGRGSFNVAANCLSVMGGIQPGKLQSFFQGAFSEDGKGDDGFLQRLQLIIWPDQIGEWKKPTSFPDKEAKEKAYAVYENINDLTASGLGAKGEEDEIPYLNFSEEAQLIWDEYRNELEIRLRSDEEISPAFDSHISKFRSLMPSLALIFHLIEVVEGKTEDISSVGEDPTRLAAAWCEYLESHAKKVYAPKLHPEVHAAHLLADKIKSGHIKDGSTIRDIGRFQWSGLRNSEAVRIGVEELQRCNWVCIIKEETNGRPAEKVYLHPDLQGESNGI